MRKTGTSLDSLFHSQLHPNHHQQIVATLPPKYRKYQVTTSRPAACSRGLCRHHLHRQPRLPPDGAGASSRTPTPQPTLLLQSLQSSPPGPERPAKWDPGHGSCFTGGHSHVLTVTIRPPSSLPTSLTVSCSWLRPPLSSSLTGESSSGLLLTKWEGAQPRAPLSSDQGLGAASSRGLCSYHQN